MTYSLLQDLCSSVISHVNVLLSRGSSQEDSALKTRLLVTSFQVIMSLGIVLS